MNFEFTDNAWEDFGYWLEQSPEIVKKIKILLNDIKRNPFQGLGKPEPFRYDLKGFGPGELTVNTDLYTRLKVIRAKPKMLYPPLQISL